jgi:hypothetical protein
MKISETYEKDCGKKKGSAPIGPIPQRLGEMCRVGGREGTPQHMVGAYAEFGIKTSYAEAAVSVS